MSSDDPRGGGRVPSILTKRLELVSMAPGFLRSTLQGDRAGVRKLMGRVEVPEDWFAGAGERLLELRLEQLGDDPAVQPWLLRAMVLRATGAMVGFIGFHTRPGGAHLDEIAPGGVEFGFTVFEGYRLRGFAYEGSLGMMRWAREERGCRCFVLTMAPNNEASMGLAKRLGFTETGAHIDAVDGLELIFVLDHGRRGKEA